MFQEKLIYPFVQLRIEPCPSHELQWCHRTVLDIIVCRALTHSFTLDSLINFHTLFHTFMLSRELSSKRALASLQRT